MEVCFNRVILSSTGCCLRISSRSRIVRQLDPPLRVLVEDRSLSFSILLVDPLFFCTRSYDRRIPTLCTGAEPGVLVESKSQAGKLLLGARGEVRVSSPN